MMKISAIQLFAVVAIAACAPDLPTALLPLGGPSPGGDDDPTQEPAQQPGLYAGGEGNTFSHAGALGAEPQRDPFDILQQRQEEGPPEIRTRLHSCSKLNVATLQNLLVGLGVDLNAESDPPSAGQLLADGKGALGAANYDA